MGPLRASQDATELLRSTPCGPNCSGVSRFGAFKALKSTATTNTATEERQITKHEYSLANTRMPKTSQEAPELLRGTPCGLNCNGVWRFGASKVLKSTATTNTATEKRQITKHHYIVLKVLLTDGDRRPKGGGPLRSTRSSSRTTSEVVGRSQRSN